MHHCPECGCITHYEALGSYKAERTVVNARLMNPADIVGVPIRHFDGASTWTYLD